jgi:hypothetical protein
MMQGGGGGISSRVSRMPTTDPVSHTPARVYNTVVFGLRHSANSMVDPFLLLTLFSFLFSLLFSLVGNDILTKAYNLHRNLDEERVSLIEAVAVKPDFKEQGAS